MSRTLRLSAVHITREHGPCPRAVRTVHGHGWRILSPVHTDRGHGRVQMNMARSHYPCLRAVFNTGVKKHCTTMLLTPVLSMVRGHRSLHGARFTLPVHTALCPRAVCTGAKFATRVTQAVFTGNVNGALIKSRLWLRG